MKPKLHILSLPHTSTTEEYISCAYTMKARNFASMMKSIGYETILYGGPENDADCSEHVVIASKEEQNAWFGEYDYHQSFYPISWGTNDAHWVISNANAILEISKRIEPKDIICVIAGLCQKQVADAFPNHMTVEYGIGYTGVFSNYKVFESYAHMHWVYGAQHNDDGKFYDCVIPNYFNPSEFLVSKDAYTVYEGKNIKVINQPKNYMVWLGRFIDRKGPQIAVEVTKRLGVNLIMAGQGVNKITEGPNGTTIHGDGISVTGHHIKHIGHVNIEERAKLLSGAKATFMATTYLEPFGGVSIESLLAGTPVIATDFGVFTETIPHGVAGYRFRTIGEATQFASEESLARLDKTALKEYAISNFSMDRVKYLYDDYFMQLMGLWEDGFYNTEGTRDDRYARFL